MLEVKINTAGMKIASPETTWMDIAQERRLKKRKSR